MERLDCVLRSSAALGGLVRLIDAHPRAAAWAVLSAGLCSLLMVAGREASVPLGPWLVILAAAVLVSGMCIAIAAPQDSDTDVPDGASENTGQPEAKRRMPTTL